MSFLLTGGKSSDPLDLDLDLLDLDLDLSLFLDLGIIPNFLNLKQ